MQRTLHKHWSEFNRSFALPLVALALAGPTAAAAPTAEPAAPTAAAAPTVEPAAQPAVSPVTERWSGRQTVRGRRSLPLLGDVETRTDFWMLASVDRSATGWAIRQSVCAVRIAEVGGVSVGMSPATVARIPDTTFGLVRDGDGVVTATAWGSGWGERDLDADGWPGLTLRVEAPMCRGRLGVSSTTRTTAQVRVASEQTLEMDVFVTVSQRVLQTDGWCLSLAETQTDERLQGRARYERLTERADCADVFRLSPLAFGAD